MATTSEFVDYFELLNLSSTASNEDIEARIRDQMRLWVKRTEAPEMSTRQQAERQVKHLTEAKRILLNASSRQSYEAELRSQPAQTPASADAMPAEGEDLVRVAYEHLAEGDALSAVYVASRATERQPGVPDAWAVLAEGKLAMDRTDDAVYEYRKAIDLKPNEPSYYFGLGDVHERREEWPQAMQNYEQASRIEPTNALYRVAIANVHIQTEQSEKAIPILEQAASDLPDSDAVHYYLALAYHDAAIESWTPVRDGKHMITTPEQASYSKELLEKAQAVNLDDGEVREMLSETSDKVSHALAKHWGYPLRDTLKWGAILFVVFLICIAISPALTLLVLAGAGFGVYLGIQPGWKVNRKYLADLRAAEGMPSPPA
jgi:tetratricopeptide (TPR) repeat protein